MKPRIVVVGSVNMDLVSRAVRMPAVGETVTGSDFRIIPGGKGANQAVAAARMGAQVALLGCVGDDTFGANLTNGLACAGIDLARLCVLQGEATGVALIIVDDEGRNSIVLTAGANDRVTFEQIEEGADAIADASMLVCQLEIPVSAVKRAIDIAQSNRVPVILNAAPARPIDRGLLASVNYLVVNETEASLLSGVGVVDRETAERAAQSLIAQGAAQVLITLGAQGVAWALKEHPVSLIPAVQVPVVDTTAAGDAFVGSLAVELANGAAVPQAIEYAQHAAALTVTKLGAQISIPHREELERFIQSRKSQSWQCAPVAADRTS